MLTFVGYRKGSNGQSGDGESNAGSLHFDELALLCSWNSVSSGSQSCLSCD